MSGDMGEGSRSVGGWNAQGGEERRTEAAGGGGRGDVEMGDMLDDSTGIQRMEVPSAHGPLKKSLLQALTAQGRDTNSSGDNYLRDIERWRLSVSV